MLKSWGSSFLTRLRQGERGASRCCLGLMLLLSLVLHAPFLDHAPGGFHRWRESDTATVAENFARRGLNFFAPEVNQLGLDGRTVVGMEFPLYNYTVALAYRSLGFDHGWARLGSWLGAALLALAMHRLMRQMLPAAPLAALAAAWAGIFNPLVFFYGGRIQPDLWALALTVFGYGQYLRWQDGRRAASYWQGALSAAIALAMAMAIKPIYLGVGLAMLPGALRQRARHAWFSPKLWLFGVSVLTPMTLWLTYARELTEAYGEAYFYLGQNWQHSLASLGNPQFYQNVLLTWPWELAVGLACLPAFLVGVRHFADLGEQPAVLAWILGNLAIFALAADHCATPHDYYYLPMVPPLALITGLGLERALNLRHASRAASRMLAWSVLASGLIAPGFALKRVDQRYVDDTEFASARTQLSHQLPNDASIITIDPMPGYQLYRAGRRGLRLTPTATLADLAAAQQRGPTWLWHDQRLGKLDTNVRAALGEQPFASALSSEVWDLSQASGLNTLPQATPLLQPASNKAAAP